MTLRRQGVVRFGGIAASVALMALASARAQTESAPGAAPKTRPPLPAGMEYYPKPVWSNGHWVLWHGVHRNVGAEGSRAAAPARAQAKEPAKSPAKIQARAVAAKPKAIPTTVLVSIGATTDARIVEDLRAALGLVGAAMVAKVGPATSKDLASGLGGADLAIARSDQIAVMAPVGDGAPPLAYVAPLFPETVTIVARDAIASAAALDGRKVAFGDEGSADVQTAALLFRALGVAPKPVFLGAKAALDALAKGDVDAAVIVGAPSASPLAGFGAGGGFHLVELAYDPALRAYFMPARVEAPLYPALAPGGAGVDALATMAVLVSRADDADGARGARVAAVSTALFRDFPALLKDGRAPEWKLAEPAARVAGLPREAEAAARAADSAKDAGQRFAAFQTASREADAGNADDRRKAFDAFMEWSRNLGR